MTFGPLRHRAQLAVIAVTLAGGLSANAEQSQQLAAYTSHHYKIYTDLSRREAEPFGHHMDAVFEQYTARFSSFRANQSGSMSLYLFKIQEHYIDFLRQYNIDGTNSGGIYIVNPQLRALATWVHNKSRSETFRTLQHEGFHQFAHNYIGLNLPIWINEGLAVYFESGILVRDKFVLGLVDVRPVKAVRRAIEHDEAIDFDRLLRMTAEEWRAMLRRDAKSAALLYDQSWSIVHFLIHAERRKYRDAFARMLHLIADGRPVRRAFTQTFGSPDTRPFRLKWEKFVRTVETDPINTAVARMEFLATGLLYLHEQTEQRPKSIQHLRSKLQQVRFRATQRSHGVTVHFDSADESMYEYRRHGRTARFQLLEPAAAKLPPRIAAPGMDPEPTLTWSRDTDGTLMHEVTFR